MPLTYTSTSSDTSLSSFIMVSTSTELKEEMRIELSSEVERSLEKVASSVASVGRQTATEAQKTLRQQPPSISQYLPASDRPVNRGSGVSENVFPVLAAQQTELDNVNGVLENVDLQPETLTHLSSIFDDGPKTTQPGFDSAKTNPNNVYSQQNVPPPPYQPWLFVYAHVHDAYVPGLRNPPDRRERLTRELAQLNLPTF